MNKRSSGMNIIVARLLNDKVSVLQICGAALLNKAGAHKLVAYPHKLVAGIYKDCAALLIISVWVLKQSAGLLIIGAGIRKRCWQATEIVRLTSHV